MPLWNAWAPDTAYGVGLSTLVGINLLLLMVGIVLAFFVSIKAINSILGYIRVIALPATCYHIFIALLVAIPFTVSFKALNDGGSLFVHVIAVVGVPAVIGGALWFALYRKVALENAMKSTNE